MKAIRDSHFLKELLGDEVYLVSEQNRYPLLVITRDEANPYLNTGDEAFLEKVLKAVDLQLHHVKLTNTAQLSPEDHFEHWQAVPSRKVISFGVNFQELFPDISLEKYQLGRLENIYFLQADSLQEISQDQEKKKLLWSALQQLFLN